MSVALKEKQVATLCCRWSVNALHFIALQVKDALQVEREIINHSCLIHPHIVRFRECFLTPKYLGIAMEYAAGGDLYKFVAAK